MHGNEQNMAALFHWVALQNCKVSETYCFSVDAVANVYIMKEDATYIYVRI